MHPNRGEHTREFDNDNVREVMKALEVKWHLNTPGHPKSKEGIERLHGTLSDHLRLYQIDKDLEPDEAMIRTIAANNHSVHTVTGFAPFEILFGLRGPKRDYRNTVIDGEEIVGNGMALRKTWDKVRERIEKEKAKRVARRNEGVRDIVGKIGIGTVVYRRVSSNRGKEPQRYEGPFRVIIIREHNREY
nr:uncharacterized protein LOC106688479 [Halyomorpha halys]